MELRKVVREAAEGFVQEWRAATADLVRLPRPVLDGAPGSLGGALARRRSIRSYLPQALTLDEIARLMWAAEGITHPAGLRSAPSAGALYPLEVLLVTGDVEGLPDGIYRYVPRGHALALVGRGDCRHALAEAALHQASIEQAPATVAITAVYGRTTPRYGERGIRYVHMEVGHLAENVCLQAAALGLGTVVVGAFHDDEVKRIIGAGGDEEPVCLVPVGRPGEDDVEPI
jgi:SagB-type dehydrogenase family enzyme